MDGVVAAPSGHGGTATEHAGGNATEHAVGGTATEHAAESTTELPTVTCTEFGLLSDVTMEDVPDHSEQYPILEVAFNNDMWWSMPKQLSQQLFDEYAAGRNVSFMWDWGGTRSGSFSPGGHETPYNRYTIDFAQMIQTNSDNSRKRSVRWIWICENDLAPVWSGQIPRRG